MLIHIIVLVYVSLIAMIIQVLEVQTCMETLWHEHVNQNASNHWLGQISRPETVNLPVQPSQSLHTHTTLTCDAWLLSTVPHPPAWHSATTQPDPASAIVQITNSVTQHQETALLSAPRTLPQAPNITTATSQQASTSALQSALQLQDCSVTMLLTYVFPNVHSHFTVTKQEKGLVWRNVPSFLEFTITLRMYQESASRYVLQAHGEDSRHGNVLKTPSFVEPNGQITQQTCA